MRKARSNRDAVVPNLGSKHGVQADRQDATTPARESLDGGPEETPRVGEPVCEARQKRWKKVLRSGNDWTIAIVKQRG